ncbi:Proteasomal ATPase-associated factor 1 [Allomyces arbusculus]|nr:Proteasomal ATPase-associated factor 1 [Allomyces arbusculus]
MSTETHFLPSITVQADWPAVVADVANTGKPESFWVSIYYNSAIVESLHGSITVRRKYTTNDLYFEGGEELDATLDKDHMMLRVSIKDTRKWPAMAWTVVAPRVSTAAPAAGRNDEKLDFVRPPPTAINAVDLSPSGELIAYGADRGLIRVLDAQDGSIRRELEGHVGDVLRVRFFPSGQVLLSTSNDLTARIWSVLDGSCPRVLKGHTGRITDSHMLLRGKRVITTSRDGSAKIWECASAECKSTLALRDPINEMALLKMATYDPTRYQEDSPNASDEDLYLGIFACDSGLVKGVHLSTQETMFECSYPRPANTVDVLDGTTLAVGYEDGAVIFWDMHAGQEVASLQASKTAVLQVRSLDSRRVVIASADGLLFVVAWSRNDGNVAIESVLTGNDLDPVYAVAVHGGRGRVVAAGRDGNVRAYELGALSAAAAPSQ